MHAGGVLGATPSPIATGPSVAVHALGTRATEPPGRESWWCRATLAHSARRAHAGRGGTACGGPAHRHPSPNYAGLDHPIGGASPSTGRVACDTPPPQAHGRRDVVAHPVPTPEEGTTGSRARR